MPRGKVHVTEDLLLRADAGDRLPLLAATTKLFERPTGPFEVDLVVEGTTRAVAQVYAVSIDSVAGGMDRVVMRVVSVTRTGPPFPRRPAGPAAGTRAPGQEPRGGAASPPAPAAGTEPGLGASSGSPERRPDYEVKLLWDGVNNLTQDATDRIGLFVATDRPHFEGEKLLVRLSMPKQDGQLVPCTVKWLQQSRSLGEIGIGLGFDAIPPDLYRVMQQYTRVRAPIRHD